MDGPPPPCNVTVVGDSYFSILHVEVPYFAKCIHSKLDSSSIPLLVTRVGKISHFSSLARLRDYIVMSREICETCETMKIEYLLSIIVQKLIKNLNSK